MANDNMGERRRYGLFFLQALLIGILAIQVFDGCLWGVRALWGPYETSYPECAVVERTIAVAEGGRLYGETRQWPYIVAPYGPLTYYPVALVARAIGFEGDREAQARLVYLMGRLVSFAAGIAILVWLWVAGGAIGLDGRWRFLPLALFFCAPRIVELWSSFRCDFPMAAFILWGWFLAWGKSKFGWQRLLAAACLLTIAALYKHTAVFSMAALAVYLISQKRWRDAVIFGAAGAILICAAWIALYLSTGGAWFDNTVLALRSPLWVSGFFGFLFAMSLINLLPIVGGLAACLGALRPDASSSAPRWAFAFSLLVAQVTVMRTGSNFYYYLEPYCWGLILTPLCARELWRIATNGEEQPGVFRRPWIAVLSLLLIPFLWHANGLLMQLPRQIAARPSLAAKYPPLKQILATASGQVLLVEGEMLWLTKSPPTMMDPFLYSVRVAAGDLDTRELIGKLARREFQYVVLAWDPDDPTPGYQGVRTLPEEVVEAIRQYYQPVQTVAHYFVMAPR